MRIPANFITFLLACSYFFVPILSYAANDAPHNDTNNISCGSCHDDAIINSPFWATANDGNYANFCLSTCHNQAYASYTDTSAPSVQTHSSTNTSENHGTWSVDCVICHDPHIQRQKLWRGTNPSDLFLATGKTTTPIPTWDEASNTSIINYSTLTYKTGITANLLSNKTLTERGAIIFPNLKKLGYSNSIVEIDNPPGTIKVEGDASKTFTYVNPPTSFGITYGQYIRQTIDVDGTIKLVKMFGTSGEFLFAYDESLSGTDPTPNGICQICHTLTSHWRNDGSLAAQNSHVRFNGVDCTMCHRHSQGFKNVYVDHSASFVVAMANCVSCHDGADPIIDTHNFTCSYCHEQNFDLKAGLSAGDCGNCHTTYAADFENGHQNESHEELTSVSNCTTTCHSGNLLTAIHQNDCANCHTNKVTDGSLRVGANGDASGHTIGTPSSCADCHSAYNTNFATGHQNESHVELTGIAKCTGCHTGAIATAVHTNGPCTDCHTNTTTNGSLKAGDNGYGTTLGHTIGGPSSCADCHPAHNTNFQNGHQNEDHDMITASTDALPTKNCVNCHNGDLIAGLWNHNNTCNDCHTDVDTDGRFTSGPLGSATGHTIGQASECIDCHDVNDFSPTHLGTTSGNHPVHLAVTSNCALCHTTRRPAPLTEPGCNTCHNDGKAPDGGSYGNPNARDYRFHWNDLSAGYSLHCNSCHNGRLNGEDIDTGCLSSDGSSECTVPDPVSCDPGARCDSCHDGGTAPPVGMGAGAANDGHSRLVSSNWIRQYPCYYCHTDTVDVNSNLTGLHVNQHIDVSIDSLWYLTGFVTGDPAPDPPYYTNDSHPPGAGEDPNSCYNVYCHSDGTTDTPKMHAYPWDGGNESCSACHGHSPAENCSSCHEDNRTWDSYPGQGWLSAMPMYGSETGANSHYNHMMSGYSCDDCHFITIKENVNCIDCHNNTGITPGEMTEDEHINPANHVNKVKDVVFKDNGTWNDTNKTCSGTICHVGSEPTWGGSSVNNDIVCKGCHGDEIQDADGFDGGKPKIDLGQWADTGHGRPGTIDPETGKPDLAINVYNSGNPPADMEVNACWYCHDSQVKHQSLERPYRLIQHEHFKKRFELECAFCHMTGADNECLTCHNVSHELEYTSLAPQLLNSDNSTRIPAIPDVINPPYTIARPDHIDYIGGGCSAATCHENDTTRHNTGAGDRSAEEIADVKHSYVMMGVCLKCHDDDSGGQCTFCHTAPVEDPDRYDAGFDPADINPALVTDGRITPQLAKASSFHFGHKHYDDYTDSLEDVLVADTVSDASNSLNALRDSVDNGSTPINWTVDAYAGLRVEVVFNDGNATTELRPIVNNTENALIVAPPFSKLVSPGDTYKVLNIVWKGGKFCWDCHDPHGDDNIYMIHNDVSTRTDGMVGKPITRGPVSFAGTSDGTDYAVNVPNGDGDYDGICNVCHTDPGMHYRADGGNEHNSSRRCTECHEHRFTNSHASGEACNTCHGNRPVPRHTAFGQSRDCTKCHSDAIGARMNVMMQFGPENSHHVQAENITNRHCYACHWEATKYGTINNEFHSGYNYSDYSSEANQPVDLVIWGAGVRPTVHDDDGLDDNDTAVPFLAWNINTWRPGPDPAPATLAQQRAEVSKVTTHCLGCHSDQNNDTKPFDLVDPNNKDCKTPRQYAWDLNSIESRYSDLSTATWGKYDGANVASKTVTKAFSAHGNAVNGGGGWDADDGIDEAIANTRPGALYNVQCFDCHSSHGSLVGAPVEGGDPGVTSSYTTYNGTKNGGNLKETQQNKGGYAMTYMASSNQDANSVNPYQAGAGQCFDCHETANANTLLTPVSKSPWGYNETFGATEKVIGYRDNPKFKGTYSGRGPDFRQSRATLGGHLRASHSNPASPAGLYDETTDPAHASYDSRKDPNKPDYDHTLSNVGAMGSINGLCTPCHDPHGVSPSLGANQAYGVPLLKGTWLSAPYKEDTPPLVNQEGFSNSYNNWSGTRPYPQAADPQPIGAWRTDRNTFNNINLSVKKDNADTYSQIGEDAETFAGLCLGCHPKSTLTSEVDAEATSAIAWTSSERIHRAVKGWGWNDGDTPREHSFTCSKCHQPHASGLPRLMQTNCLNYSHRGQLASGGLPTRTTSSGHYYQVGRFPYGWYGNGQFENFSTAICHGSSTANGSGGWPNNQGWNTVTPW